MYMYSLFLCIKLRHGYVYMHLACLHAVVYLVTYFCVFGYRVCTWLEKYT